MTRLVRLLRDEDGSSTIEFVLLFPFVFGLFLSTFELGMLLTRQVMLDRGIDLAVRQVRLGLVANVTHDVLKTMICNAARMIPDCANQLKLEMIPVDPRGWRTLRPDVDCVDRLEKPEAVRDFQVGLSNELMVLRACALIDPYFPSNVLGFPNISNENGKAFAVTATTTFVIEPS